MDILIEHILCQVIVVQWIIIHSYNKKGENIMATIINGKELAAKSEIGTKKKK